MMHRIVGAALASAGVILVAVIAVGVALGDGAPASGAPSCPKPPRLPASFVGQIDNPYLPLKPGAVLPYKGKVDGKSATDVFTVTNQTRMILGTRDDGHPRLGSS